MNQAEKVIDLFLKRQATPLVGGVVPVFCSDGTNLYEYDMKVARWKDGQVEILRVVDFSRTTYNHLMDLYYAMVRKSIMPQFINPVRVECDRGTMVGWSRPIYRTHWLYFPDEVPDEEVEKTLTTGERMVRLNEWVKNHRSHSVIDYYYRPWVKDCVVVFQIGDYDYTTFSRMAVWKWLVEQGLPELFQIDRDYHIWDHGIHAKSLWIRYREEDGQVTDIANWWFKMRLDELYQAFQPPHAENIHGLWGIKNAHLPNVEKNPLIKPFYDKSIIEDIALSLDCCLLDDYRDVLPLNLEKLIPEMAAWLFKQKRLYTIADEYKDIEFKDDAVLHVLKRFRRYLDPALRPPQTTAHIKLVNFIWGEE